MSAENSSPVMVPIAMIFKINDDLLRRAVDGLTKEELWQRPTDKNNPMLWILGHVVQTRARILQLLDEPFDTGWGNLFGRGAPLKEQAPYPPLKEITRILNEVNRLLYAKFESLDDAQLARAAQGLELPRAKTLADQLAFFGLHESYHVGQMGYVRKALGHPALVG